MVLVMTSILFVSFKGTADKWTESENTDYSISGI